MPTYTICSNFIRECSADVALCRNTLFRFVPDVPLRIAVDSEKMVIDEYAAIAKTSDIVFSWLTLLSYKEGDVYDIACRTPKGLSGVDLCFSICSALKYERKLICSQVQDYANHQVGQMSVTLFDRTVAPGELQRACNTCGTPNVPLIDQIVRDLGHTRVGHASAGTFHRIVDRALREVFYPQLRYFKIEQEINQGRKRIDILASNTQSPGFFSDLAVVHHIHCPYVPIECKNYRQDLENPELDQLVGRFSNTRGNFGLLVCRRIQDADAILRSCKDILHAGNGYVIVLDDSDILQLLQCRKIGDDAGISAHLHARLRDLLT